MEKEDNKKESVKKILDSVHGYIYIENAYIKNIVDTPHFQRLRRIEQTSTRPVFPSARHDRFIHSLGCFHIGKMIVNHLLDTIEEEIDDHVLSVFESYKIACLLHDVGHAPFSHTFEEYFDNKESNLRGDLIQLVNDESFKTDWYEVKDPSAPHERMSAIVALGIYGEFIESRKAKKELVARMIIGLKYGDCTHYSLENAMIELLHGDVIDADRLDYVCRDTWAAGYSSTTVDIDRLVDSIQIKKDPVLYKLCFTSKCFNEIESVLTAKTFQQFYVINHHTVSYEKQLLTEAVKSAAQYHFFGRNDDNKAERDAALFKLCNIKALYDVNDPEHYGIETDNTHIKISLPKDDDFVSLMAYISDDKYVKQWYSRQYSLKPLWKSKAEFYFYFQNLRNVTLIEGSWIFSEDCVDFISNKFNLKDNIWMVRATAKYKTSYSDKISILVKDKVVLYKDLLPKDVQPTYEPPQNEFYYIYVPQNSDIDSIIKALQKENVKYYR